MHYTEKDFLETAGPETLELIAQTRALTREYNNTDYRDKEKKRTLLQQILGRIEENVSIDTPFYCNHGKKIFVGNDVCIGMNCTFVDDTSIRIGNRVMIASNVQIYTASHPVLPQERLIDNWKDKSSTFFRTYALEVIIEDNAWIGGGTVILPGVTIGENTVVGAGSVVTRSIPANCVAVGNPCKVIRKF